MNLSLNDRLTLEAMRQRERELVNWDQEIAGSAEQIRYREKQLSGGTISPRQFGGSTTFLTKPYLE